MKCAFLLGSRAEWGYIRPVIQELVRSGHEHEIICTNTSILAEYGDISREIKQNFNISHRYYNAFSGGDSVSVSKAFGNLILSLSDFMTDANFDWIVLAGDRTEQLAAAIVAAICNKPSAHIQAGEKSGSLDDRSRHAIARFTNLHFASNMDAANRLLEAGEEPWRVHTTGAPQIDSILDSDFKSTRILDDFGLIQKAYYVACLHSATEADENTSEISRGMLNYFESSNDDVIWVLPNNDSGSLEIRNILLQSKNRKIRTVDNLRRDDFLSLLYNSAGLIGNSSSGILEAPTLRVPAVNIGSRQDKRFRGSNVIDIENANQLPDALKMISNEKFLHRLQLSENPYGQGESSPKIVKILQENLNRPDLLRKRLTI